MEKATVYYLTGKHYAQDRGVPTNPDESNGIAIITPSYQGQPKWREVEPEEGGHKWVTHERKTPRLEDQIKEHISGLRSSATVNGGTAQVLIAPAVCLTKLGKEFNMVEIKEPAQDRTLVQTAVDNYEEIYRPAANEERPITGRISTRRVASPGFPSI